MRNLNFILLLMCFFAVPALKAQRYTPNMVDSLGYKQGVWTEYSISFEIATGEVLLKFPDSNKEYYSLAKNKDRKYFPIIESIGEYVNGIKTGTWKTYYWNGNIRSETEYQNGVAFGKAKAYYFNGSLMSECIIGDELSFPIIIYDESGNIIMDTITTKRDFMKLEYEK